MKNLYFKTGAALLLALACVSAWAAEESVAVKLADLPPAIKKAIHEQAGKAKVDSIEKVTDHGEVTYSVEIGRAARARSFTLDENGELLDLEINLVDAPPAIQAAIKKTAGTGTIDGITKVFDEGEVSYDVDITRDNQERSFSLDDQGKLTELQVFLGELPAAVRQTIEKESAGVPLGDINKEFDEDGTTYEVEINPDANPRTLSLDEKGAIVSDEQEVTLTKTPDAVQKTIKDTLKDGELGDITQTIDEYGTNFDVDMKSEGKWKTVVITLDGQTVK